MLDKLGGTFAPRPSTGPHSLKECIPLCLLLTKKLQYAENSKEISIILNDKQIKINGRVRTDKKFPVGFMDVLEILKTKESFRLLYNTNKKFLLHRITDEENNIKLCKVVNKATLSGDIPHIYTDDGSTFRYVDPSIKVGDTIKLDLSSRKVIDFISFGIGKTAFITKGKNLGCVGTIFQIDEKEGICDTIHLKDSAGRTFLTQKSNVFVIGDENNVLISLPEEKGVKISEYEKSNLRYGELIERNEGEEEESISEENNEMEEEE
ncbi:ribosomal protein S4 [Hamiltosporidium tvaerminnensis]|uniref:40S ribosomal protein S4 n=2 Tax=Hamiltosporidium TaxID=1176354 RepID=A0A4Q9LPS6_9MICR|nr:40S ribosomal protein S4 [Hamiltosporidium tvaerminnensis]TBT99279.1 ribosomal protein S4 [Hamiltosporidium tvaerminnensis]TBU02682.1 ribosomal protein S4 [Hamiltosporidium magnivora]TBU10046.1 ribosomal protein S4 [Hamiltosporidium tvaerminnensis]